MKMTIFAILQWHAKIFPCQPPYLIKNFKSLRRVNEYDVVVSLFNLHTQNREEQVHFIRQMRQSASKAIFLEYENPERNIAYLGYLPVILGQYISLYYENRKKSVQNSQLQNMKSYLKRGALEGILYELPTILPESSITVLQRKSFGIGGIGMAYLEWD